MMRFSWPPRMWFSSRLRRSAFSLNTVHSALISWSSSLTVFRLCSSSSLLKTPTIITSDYNKVYFFLCKTEILVIAASFETFEVKAAYCEYHKTEKSRSTIYLQRCLFELSDQAFTLVSREMSDPNFFIPETLLGDCHS